MLYFAAFLYGLCTVAATQHMQYMANHILPYTSKVNGYIRYVTAIGMIASVSPIVFFGVSLFLFSFGVLVLLWLCMAAGAFGWGLFNPATHIKWFIGRWLTLWGYLVSVVFLFLTGMSN